MPGQRTQPRQTAPPTWKQPVAAGLVYSLATYCSLPPLGIWPCTFIAAIALVWGGCRLGAGGTKLKRGAFLAALGSLPVWFAEEAWLTNVTPVGYPLLAMWLAFWSGMIVYAIARLRATGWDIPMAAAAPLVWVAVEMLRGDVILTGYPWYFAGHPLIDAPILCLPARVLGAYFVSALVVAVAGCLADAAGWSRVSRRAGGIGIATIVLLWVGTSILGAVGAKRSEPTRELRVGIVQTNIPQGQKLAWTPARQVEDFRRFIELTSAAATKSPELILWPETMFPGWGLNAEALTAARRFTDSIGEKQDSYLRVVGYGYADALCRVQDELNIPMVVGAEAREGVKESDASSSRRELREERRYNSAAVIAGGQLLEQRYDKVELTPMGEVIPWVWRWPSIQKLVLDLGAGGMRFDLAFGRAAAPIDVPLVSGGSVRVGTPICFEVTRTSLCRKLVYAAADGRAADVLCNLSNDGWFGSEEWWLVSCDAKRRQHLLTARWRCMELGVPMVRAVNTGVSGFIDDRGRVSPGTTIGGDGVAGAAGARTEAAIVGTVRLGSAGTIYGKVGNIFGWFCFAAGGGLLLTAWWRNRRIGRG